jgi:uncharacterized protein (TIGR03083 family)
MEDQSKAIRTKGGAMADQPALNTMSFAAKPVMLDVIRHERKKFYDLIEDPANWNVQSRCTEWETRDIVGHMIDVTEGYLERWAIARQGGSGENYGLPAMADRANERAQAFRSLPRGEAISRLQKSSDELLAILDAVGEDEWSNFLVPHAYMGPLPTLFYFSFQIMDYGVHTWDIRYGLGDTLGVLEERTAGVLVPYMFVLMSATVDGPSAAGLSATYGIEVSGEWGGKWRVDVADGAFTYAPEEQDLHGCQALFQFDPSDFVLSSFLRFPGGAASGDPDVIERVRHMFFRI